MEMWLLEQFRYFIIHFALIPFLKSEHKEEKKYFHNTVGGHRKWSLFPDILDYDIHSDNHLSREMKYQLLKWN